MSEDIPAATAKPTPRAPRAPVIPHPRSKPVEAAAADEASAIKTPTRPAAPRKASPAAAKKAGDKMADKVALGAKNLWAGMEAAAGKGKIDMQTFDELCDDAYGPELKGRLPLQFLFGVDVLPMERALTIVGAPGSFKSLFAKEILKILIVDAEGFASAVFTENKENVLQFRGVIQNDEILRSSVRSVHAKSLDHMLASLHHSANTYNKSGMPDHIPFGILVDSLTAAGSNASQEEMKKTGVATAGFAGAHSAASITNQLKAFLPTHLHGKPVSLIVVNHQKPSMEPTAPFSAPKKNEPGGLAKDFAFTWILEMSAKYKADKVPGETCLKSVAYIATKKSGFSDRGRKIDLPLVTTYFKSGKELAMKVDFLWNTCLVDMLLDEKFLGDFPEVEKACAIREGKIDASKGYYCPEAGVMKPVSKEELGAAIHAHEDTVRALQDAMYIFRKRKLGEKLREAVNIDYSIVGRASVEGTSWVPVVADETADDIESEE